MTPEFYSAFEAAACPIDWTTVTGREDVEVAGLYYEWIWAYSHAGVTTTDQFFVSDVIMEQLTESTLIEIYKNSSRSEHKHICDLVRSRREQAVSLYMSGIGRLANLHFMSSREYDAGKHSPGGLAREEIIRATSRKNSSRFFQEQSDKDIEKLFWDWLGRDCHPCLINRKRLWPDVYIECNFPEPAPHAGLTKVWEELRGRGDTKAAYDACVELGASEGEAVTYVMFEINCSSKTVHAYPVSEKKAAKTLST